MAYPAENLDFEDPSGQQLDQLKNGESDTGTVIEINDLRSKIGDKIARAEEEGVINRTDADKLRLGLQKSEKNKQEVFAMGSEVNKVIEESKQLMSVIDDKEELALFREMSLDEKRQYVSGLRSQAAKLNARADKLSAMLPAGAKDKLKILKGPERAKYIEELNVRRENVAKYGGLLGKYEKHFSGKTAEEFMAQFKEKSLSGQKEWIDRFEEKEGKPRAELTKKYESLPPEYRGRIKDFFSLRHHEKKAEVDKVREELDFDNELESETGKQKGASYMSGADRKSAKDAFRTAPSSMRREMKSKIRDFISAEAKLGTRFESLSKDAQADIKNRYGDFRELSFQKKEKALEEVEGEGGKLNKQYGQKLMKEKADKVISESTYKSYVAWFEKQGVADRRHALKTGVFDAQEMAPRRQLKQRFERELPPAVQAANKLFYELSGHERMELFEKLKSEEEQNKSGQKAEAGPQAGDEKETSVKKPTVMTQVKAVSDGEKHDVPYEREIAEEINCVKDESQVLKDKIRNKTIGEGLAELAANSEMVNQGIHVSAKRDKHLSGKKERRVNEKLVEHTGGKMVADTGRGKARMVNEVDLRKLGGGVMTEDQILSQKKVVTDNVGDKKQNVFETQIIDRESGQKHTGSMARDQVRKQDEALKKEITARVAARLDAKGRAGGKNAEKVKARVDKDKLKVDLRPV